MERFNAYNNILNQVDKMIDEAIRSLPKSIIVRVVNAKKNTVDVVNIDLKATMPSILTNIPIIRPIYNHYPVKIGDIGVCLTVDYAVEPLLKNSKILKQALQKNANGSGYLFFPFASLDNDMSTDFMANEMYSLDGKTQYIIDNLKTELKDRFNNDIVIDAKGIKITDTNKNEITINNQGITINDLNKNNATLDNNGIKITDLNKNTAELSSSGIKITDANNNNIEMASAGITIKDANGNSAELSSSGITLKDASGNTFETSSTSVTVKNSSCKIELGPAGVNINNGALEIMP